ncbi:MAG TPA: hypothetical protein VK735_11455 [Pseudonocardia sp.]|uniref:hypothetical protein n=1 Tax=Pseudonocardia sp. TaxID=60912 RepID=UPI002CC82378|nr:hypothetical protein [Pseudonocardia sp.]HTF48057.1 hypothetical protein [Pseudonocardia sp.]
MDGTARWVDLWQALAASRHPGGGGPDGPWWIWTYVPGTRSVAIGDDLAEPVRRSHTALISLAALLIGSCTAVVAFSWLHGHRVPVAGRELFFVISIGLAGTAGVIAGGATRDGLRFISNAVQNRHTMRLQAARWTAITLDTFRTGAYPPGNPAAGVSMEGQLVAVATVVARRIHASRAWQSTHLDTHRVRLDLAEDVRQLAVRAARLHGTRRKLGPRPQPISPGLTRAAELWESHSLVADRVQKALAERVSALITYYEHLETLSDELAALDLLSGASIDDQLDELLAGTVGDQQAAQHLRDLTAEARASITAIHDVMQLLTHDLRTLQAADNIAPRHDQG